MDDLKMDAANWRTSSRSGGNGNCVEVADNLAAVVAVRDSKDPSGPVLVFAAEEWRRFTIEVQGGEFNRS